MEKKTDKIGIDLFHKGDLFEKDFKSNYDIVYFFYNLSIGEYCMSEHAYTFFEKKFGIENIAEIILKAIQDGVSFKYKQKEDIINWIKKEGIDEPQNRKELGLELE